jgi:hypothetical protein
MGGEKEREELTTFEKLLATCIAHALLEDLRKEGSPAPVDVRTLLMREGTGL